MKQWTRPTSPNISEVSWVKQVITEVRVRIFNHSLSIDYVEQIRVKFQWSDHCEKIFTKLKNRLTTAPVLTFLKCSDGYVIYCDVSIVDLSCVLMQ